MDKLVSNMKNIITPRILLYMGIALVAILILSIVMMVMRKKQTIKQLEQLEQRYNTLKGIPLAFKLNKAVALSRVNEAMSTVVEECKTDFDEVQEKLKTCSVDLAECDDCLLYTSRCV